MARGPEIPKQDAERAPKVLESEQRIAPPALRKTNAYGSCLVFVIALAIAGAIVYYIFLHKDQFGQLWHRATHPDSVPTQTVPDQ
jgi:hypothetical protein